MTDLIPLADETVETVPWFTAAIGELAVGRELDGLDEAAGWTILSSVPGVARDNDIDHVAIGAAGVFTISTKHHAGQRVLGGRTEVFVAGQTHHYVRNAVFAAERASELLTTATGFGVIAQPVLAFVRAKEITGKRAVNGVRLVDAEGLVQWLQRQPVIWDTDASSAVARAARRADFWAR
jgi:hypothetical protein